jgi:hypothetical protein
MTEFLTVVGVVGVLYLLAGIGFMMYTAKKSDTKIDPMLILTWVTKIRK